MLNYTYQQTTSSLGLMPLYEETTEEGDARFYNQLELKPVKHAQMQPVSKKKKKNQNSIFSRLPVNHQNL